MQTKIITSSANQTQKLGEKLALQLCLEQALRLRSGQAVVLGLQGNLGGGKTTFLQGFAKGLGIKEKILSPTFVLIKRFSISKKKFKNFYHIDCYRIHNIKDIKALGFGDIILNSENIVAVEWSDKIKKILPKSAITIKFDFISKSKREIIIDF